MDVCPTGAIFLQERVKKDNFKASETHYLIKEACREVRQQSEPQRGVMMEGMPKKYNQLSIHEALETAKKRLAA